MIKMVLSKYITVLSNMNNHPSTCTFSRALIGYQVRRQSACMNVNYNLCFIFIYFLASSKNIHHFYNEIIDLRLIPVLLRYLIQVWCHFLLLSYLIQAVLHPLCTVSSPPCCLFPVPVEGHRR